MGHLGTTYQHIADILSFESSRSALEKALSNPVFNWDAIVVEGSRHLVLPAIYCRLKAKNLLHCLPEELQTYLKELTAINRNRNVSILKQVHAISELLNAHQIEHVFLKGAALLAKGCYEDNAERMVGDIDILVAKEDLFSCHDLLCNNDYIKSEPKLGEKYFKHIHLPRLKPKTHICSVELHEKLFKSFYDKDLCVDDLLKNIKSIKDVSVPSFKQLFKHNILAYQINDNGRRFNSINFRSSYDTIILAKNLNSKPSINSQKLFRHYFQIMGAFFNDLREFSNYEPNFQIKFYLFKLRHIGFYKFWNRIIRLIFYVPLIVQRLLLFLNNKSYRSSVIKERSRILKHIFSLKRT